jgi:hypothetical protein
VPFQLEGRLVCRQARGLHLAHPLHPALRVRVLGAHRAPPPPSPRLPRTVRACDVSCHSQARVGAPHHDWRTPAPG